MFFLGESIWDNISTTIYGLFLQIDSIIYWIAAQLYEIFNTVAGARLVSAALSQDIINIANLVAGVAALFLVAYTIMLRVINPDAKSGGDTKLLKQIVLSVSLVVLSPFIFDFLYGFQNAVVNNNVIPDIILGDLSSDEATLEEYAALKFNDRYLCDYEEESGDTEAVDRTAVCTVDQMESEDTSACIENYETFDEAKEKCDKILTSTMSEQEALTLKNQQVGNNLAMSVYTSFLYPRNNKDVVIETTGFIAIDEESNPGKDFVHGACRVTGWVTSVLTTPLTFFPVLDGIASLPEAAICYFAKDEMKWSEVIDYTIQSGDFSITLATANPIVDGDMTYVFILSTIAGGFLCYMLFSFTLDLAVRAAKLAFLQMIAPIPLFLSIIPSNNDLLKNWVKKVLATYAEVFVRILCMVIAMYLISNISVVLNTEGIGGIAYVIVVLGIITFARQLPKFFSEVTGLKGDGIKLGIGEKLADAGVFTAGSILGGGLTAATRNAVSGIKGKKNFANIAASTLAGFGSGAVRAGKAGWGAKKFGDMTEAAGKGASKAVSRRIGRSNRNARYLSYKGAEINAKRDYETEMTLAAAMPVGTQAERDAKAARIEKATKAYNEIKKAAFKNSRIGTVTSSLKNYVGIDSIEDMKTDIEFNKSIIEQKEAIENVRDIIVNSDAMQDAIVNDLEKVAGTLNGEMIIGKDSSGTAITREVKTSLRDMSNLINRYDREGMTGNVEAKVSFVDHTGTTISAGTLLNDAQKATYLASLRQTHTLLTKHIGKKTATASLGGKDEVERLLGNIADNLTAGQKANILKAETAGKTMVQLSNEKPAHFIKITGDPNFKITQNDWDSMDNAGNKANDNNVVVQMELREAQNLQQKQKEENQ